MSMIASGTAIPVVAGEQAPPGTGLVPITEIVDVSDGEIIARTLYRIESILEEIRDTETDLALQVFSGATTSGSGAATVQDEALRVPQGEKWLVDRVVVSVGGASAAAICALYSMPSQGGTPDETRLRDFAGAMVGNSPSRTVLQNASTPVTFFPGEYLTVTVTGAVAANPVVVVVIGRRIKLPDNE